jgi:acetyl-CoA carboxylase carboxyl transferase subunit beta
LLDHGAIDMILDRRKMRDEVGDLLAKFSNLPTPVSAS